MFAIFLITPFLTNNVFLHVIVRHLYSYANVPLSHKEANLFLLVEPQTKRSLQSRQTNKSHICKPSQACFNGNTEVLMSCILWYLKGNFLSLVK